MGQAGGSELRTDDFDYDLPAELIAQTPVEPRDSSRLLVVHRATGELEHRTFAGIAEYLEPGDLLVANDSRVLPGRLWARKPTGGRVELLLLRPLEDGWWESLARPVHRLRAGTRLTLAHAPEVDELAGSRTVAAAASPTAATHGEGQDAALAGVEVGERTPAGGVRVRFDAPVEAVVARFGRAPLPPYIHTPLADPERYQTVYARVTGSAAAPTAGLHFTPRLLDELAARGVRLAFVTLHVGPDTFRPVRAERIVEHQMHAEFATVPPSTAEAVRVTRAAGRRVVAVGTTAVRTLEAWAQVEEVGGLRPPRSGGQRVERQDAAADGWSGWTRLFIYPGFAFRAVDALITNFHLPRSTLLMLVSAFAGRALVQRAYQEAIQHRYRFYSFGDCCLFS
jgi:S-adenosylmethionine:tRNA ribosyltransferase-isomerase